MRVYVCAYGFGRLKVTLIALLRPAHLPQSVSNQSRSVKHTSLATSGSIWCVLGFARACLILTVISPTFVLIDVHKFSKEVLVVFPAFKKKCRPPRGVLFLLFLWRETRVIQALSFQLKLCFVALQ